MIRYRAKGAMAAMVLIAVWPAAARQAQVSLPAQPAVVQGASVPSEAVLLTVFLKHDQSKNVAAIQEQARAQGFYKNFPPEGVEVVSWTVAMGLGQIVVLRVPPDRLRAVNLTIENGAWGPFRTEIYATYDFRAIAGTLHEPLAKR